jgi:hypothetical protein
MITFPKDVLVIASPYFEQKIKIHIVYMYTYTIKV